jgi:UDP-N-acetylmuramate dehydrogenase
LIFAGLKVGENISLKSFNTMGVSASARFYCAVENVDELKEAISWGKDKNLKIMTLGGGSNILFTSDFDGLIIHNNITGKVTLQENAELVHLYVGAGEVWHDLVRFAVRRDWYGIENLALIPGSVGAAPLQNIGAYGVELKDVLVRVHALDIDSLEEISFTNEECQFAYRDSIFKQEKKGQLVIFGIEIILSKIPSINIEYGDIRKVLEEKNIMSADAQAIYDAVCKIRQSKLPDPKELGNTGSFFKNPIVEKKVLEKIQKSHPEAPFYPIDNEHIKIPAGWLIEQSGWKGKRVGNTGNHEKQALVIVNYGDATGTEILEHARNVIDDIDKRFGIRLQPEVNIID